MGKYIKKGAYFKSYIGARFGNLTVISESDRCQQTKYRKVTCQCDCGNILANIPLQNLIYPASNRKSIIACQVCIDKQKIIDSNLKGKRFGKLTIIDVIPRENGKEVLKVTCKCDCGNFKEIRESYLISGHTKSCGCTQSHGEERVGQLFLEHSIYYEKEKTFEGLSSDKGTPLRLDYYLPEYNCAIEYDGIQHFALIKSGWDDEERYNLRVYHDLLKVKYCIDNDITLIKIPYTHRDTVSIEDILPSTSSFVISTLKDYELYRNNYKDTKKYYKWYKKV